MRQLRQLRHECAKPFWRTQTLINTGFCCECAAFCSLVKKIDDDATEKMEKE
jgi:hypothetical protein